MATFTGCRPTAGEDKLNKPDADLFKVCFLFREQRSSELATLPLFTAAPLILLPFLFCTFHFMAIKDLCSASLMTM